MANDRAGEVMAAEGIASKGLAYEGVNASQADTAWRLLRLALILWSSIVLVRHLSYWSSSIYFAGVSTSLTPARPILFAGAEAIVLAGVLFLAIRIPRRPASLAPIAALSIAYIAINLLAFAIDNAATGSRLTEAGGLRFLWLLASRLQLLVVPAVAVIEWKRAKR